MSKPTYTLDNENESNRLENQAKMPCYDPIRELENISFQDNIHLLDAGCGTGIVSRYLLNRYENIQIDACDLSKQRLTQAFSLSKNEQEKEIRYFQSSLENIQVDADSYDTIVCRFVLQHLSDAQIAVNEFYRISKKGGHIILIDVDGIFFNLYSQNEKLNKYLDIIKQSVDFDFYIGRKLPVLLKNSGFKNIDYKVESMYFTNDQLQLEHKNYIERFSFVSDILFNILKDKNAVTEFTTLYLDEVLKPENTLFYNKFIVQATK